MNKYLRRMFVAAVGAWGIALAVVGYCLARGAYLDGCPMTDADKAAAYLLLAAGSLSIVVIPQAIVMAYKRTK